MLLICHDIDAFDALRRRLIVTIFAFQSPLSLLPIFHAT